MKLILESTELITPTIRRLTFVPEEPHSSIAFFAGAHAELEVLAEGELVVRRYSIISDPENTGSLSIAVKDRGPRSASRALHRLVRGQTIRLVSIRNEFELGVHSHTVLIAGGVGATLILSLARELHRRGTSFEVHVAARTQDEISFEEEFRTFSPEKCLFYSGTAERPELVLEDLFARLTPESHVYVCGPREMIESVRAHFHHQGWDQNRIHFESFGAFWRPEDKEARIKLLFSGVELQVEPGETVLDSLIKNDIFVSYECKRGECGKCAVSFANGGFDHRDHALTTKDRDTMVCTCVSWPTTASVELEL